MRRSFIKCDRVDRPQEHEGDRRRHRARMSLILGAVLLLGVGGAGLATAQELRVESRSRVFDFGPGLVEDSSELDGMDPRGLMTGSSVSEFGDNAGATTTGEVAAGYGYLRGRSLTEEAYTLLTGSVGTLAEAEYFDLAIINRPGMTGEPGTRTALISIVQADSGVTGTDDDSSGIFANASVALRIASEQRNFSGSWGTDSSTDDFPSKPLVVSFDFVYGQPFEISGRIRMNTGLAADGGSASGTALAQFPASIHWMGITDLAEDEQVTGMIDWSQPAPVITNDNVFQDRFETAPEK